MEEKYTREDGTKEQERDAQAPEGQGGGERDAAGREAAEKKSEKGKGKKRGRTNPFSVITTVLLAAAMLGGIGLLLYPTVSETVNALHQSQAISSYASIVESMNEEENERLWQEALDYNAWLRGAADRFRMSEEELAKYNSILNVSGTGIMGYVDIPKISVKLPVYHGTEEAVLQVAIGHLTGTSLPVGGEGSHAAISGHRGLPSAKLFTRLDELLEGDIFIFHILNRKLTYQVDQIRVVLPSELENLELEAGKDLCTLVTCTPYGVNSHRLLVRGHRIENLPEEQETAVQTELPAGNSANGRALPEWLPLAFAGFAVLVLLFALLVPVRKKPAGKKTGKAEEKS